jgi:hypothetical protein
MIDFLTHLAARSLRAEPAIRPRLAARFEPAPAVPGAHPGLELDWAGEDEAGRAVPGDQAAPAQAGKQTSWEQVRPPAPPPWTGPHALPMLSPLRAADPVRGLEEVGASGSDADELAPAVQRPGDPAGQFDGDRGADSRPGPPDRQSIPAPVARPIPASAAPANPSLDEFARAVRMLKEELAAGPGPAGTVRPAVPQAEANAGLERVQPQRRQAASAPTPARDEREPDIHITIGRVEVRAVTEARPPRSASPSGPRLTLADYLKSRTGGGS